MDAYKDKIIAIVNKSDLPYSLSFDPTSPRLRRARRTNGKNTTYQVCTTDKNSVNTVEIAIQNKISSLFESIGSPFLLNQRHFNNLLSLETNLHSVIDLMGEHTNYELVSFHLQDALSNLSELTGKSISEAGMDAVFREFCVGK